MAALRCVYIQLFGEGMEFMEFFGRSVGRFESQRVYEGTTNNDHWLYERFR